MKCYNLEKYYEEVQIFMDNTKFNEVRKKYVRRSRFWFLTLYACFVLSFILPISFIAKICISVISLLALIASRYILSRKYIGSVLDTDLDPETYKALFLSLKGNDKYSVNEIFCAYLLNDYDTVFNICKLKLADKKYKSKTPIYLLYIARIYFDTGNYEKLKGICQELDSYFSTQKNVTALRNKYKLFTFYNLYLDEKYDDCYDLYNSLYSNPKFTNLKINKIQTGYTYAFACLKSNHIEEATEIFRFIADEAPHLNFGIIAQKQLNFIETGEEINYETKEFTQNPNFTLTLKKNKINALTLILLIAVFISLVLISYPQSVKVSPKPPAEAIASNFNYPTQLIDTIPLDNKDLLAIYKTNDFFIAVGYLDYKEDYKYTLTSYIDGLSSNMDCSMAIAQCNVVIDFSVYNEESEIPKDNLGVATFENNNITEYLCVKSLEEKFVLIDTICSAPIDKEEFKKEFIENYKNYDNN